MSRKPRLLVVVNVFEPDLGGGVLFSDLCYALAERGFDVTVRCAYPYYPEWTDKSGRNGLAIQRYEKQGVQVERMGLYIPSDPNSFKQRLVYEASFFASLLRRVPRRGQYDLIMVFCPLMGAVAYGALAKRLAGCPLWLNVQDLPADAAAAGGIASGNTVERVMEATQNGLFNQADVWSTISPVMVERLETLRRRDQPVHYLPNWLHATLARALAALPSKEGRLPEAPVRLLYSGNVGSKQDLLRFCRVLHASEAAFRFEIRAGGSRAGDVRAWVATTGDDRFAFRDLTDEAGLAQALHDADLFVITERTGSGGSFIPSKLIPGVSAGTPILAVSDPDSPLGREMRQHQAGFHTTWDDVEAVPALLADLPEQPERYHAWQRSALERAAFYDRDHVTDRYAEAVRAVIAGSTA